MFAEFMHNSPGIALALPFILIIGSFVLSSTVKIVRDRPWHRARR